MANNPYVNKVVFGSATLVDLTGTTATADKILQGYGAFGADGAWMDGTATGGGTGAVWQDQNGYVHLDDEGGGGGATQHVIHLEFTDSTDTDIDVYYDDSLIGTMITAYTPETYGQKTVDVAELDGVAWYTRPTEIWETLLEGITNINSDTPYNMIWLSDLASVYPTANEVYRITISDNEYRCTAQTANTSVGNQVCVGNPKYTGGTDDGSSVPFNFYNAGWDAWVGDTELPQSSITIKIERRVTA